MRACIKMKNENRIRITYEKQSVFFNIEIILF